MLPLMQREWLQHRFAWSLLVAGAAGAGNAGTVSAGQIDFDIDGDRPQQSPAGRRWRWARSHCATTVLPS
jgi:hypothetical protein